MKRCKKINKKRRCVSKNWVTPLIKTNMSIWSRLRRIDQSIIIGTNLITLKNRNLAVSPAPNDDWNIFSEFIINYADGSSAIAEITNKTANGFSVVCTGNGTIKGIIII